MSLVKKTCAVFLCAIMFFACSKKAESFGVIKETKEKIADPRIEKFYSVYNGMNERFKTDVKISEEQLPAFLDELESILASDTKNLLQYVAKNYYLSPDYEPEDLIKVTANENYNVSRNDLSLREDAYIALNVLGAAAKQDGIKIMVSSTYRSYEYQKWLFQHWVDVDGLEEAERESARAGSSQHQLGVAVDFGSITDDFAETAMCKWIDSHSHQYGWSLSFPKEYEDITGFRWECWHFRYIGVEACKFQEKYFNNIQHYMLEFMHNWKNYNKNS